VSTSGSAAEEAAARFLAQHGLELLHRNYRCRFGEIDLILRDGRTLVFVEVRYRGSKSFGGAAESITAAKREKLLRAARHYMAEQQRFPACRFDAVLIDGGHDNVEWVKNAFGE
jgi:putative endonuclease